MRPARSAATTASGSRSRIAAGATSRLPSPSPPRAPPVFPTLSSSMTSAPERTTAKPEFRQIGRLSGPDVRDQSAEVLDEAVGLIFLKLAEELQERGGVALSH